MHSVLFGIFLGFLAGLRLPLSCENLEFYQDLRAQELVLIFPATVLNGTFALK